MAELIKYEEPKLPSLPEQVMPAINELLLSAFREICSLAMKKSNMHGKIFQGNSSKYLRS